MTCAPGKCTMPALRIINTVGTVTDGTIFFWFDADDRPVAAVQVYRTNSGSWHLVFSSLSVRPLSAGTVWNPVRSGVHFQQVPGAAEAAAMPEQRMRRMREPLDGFKGGSLKNRKQGDASDRLRVSTSDAVVFRNATIIRMRAVGRSRFGWFSRSSPHRIFCNQTEHSGWCNHTPVAAIVVETWFIRRGC